MKPMPLLVEIEPLPWSAERKVAAAAVASPNQARVAQAALEHLKFGANGDDFAAWCDAQSPAAASSSALASAPASVSAPSAKASAQGRVERPR